MTSDTSPIPLQVALSTYVTPLGRSVDFRRRSPSGVSAFPTVNLDDLSAVMFTQAHIFMIFFSHK